MHDKRGADHQTYLWRDCKPAVKRFLIFSWAAGGRGRESFWARGKGYYKRRATRRTTIAAARNGQTWGRGANHHSLNTADARSGKAEPAGLRDRQKRWIFFGVAGAILFIILGNIELNPQVIGDDVWAKLVWAGLNLEESDSRQPSGHLLWLRITG
jgi:hypothetical protein